jgi:hypothetical protein
MISESIATSQITISSADPRRCLRRCLREQSVISMKIRKWRGSGTSGRKPKLQPRLLPFTVTTGQRFRSSESHAIAVPDPHPRSHHVTAGRCRDSPAAQFF